MRDLRNLLHRANVVYACYTVSPLMKKFLRKWKICIRRGVRSLFNAISILWGMSLAAIYSHKWKINEDNRHSDHTIGRYTCLYLNVRRFISRGRLMSRRRWRFELFVPFFLRFSRSDGNRNNVLYPRESPADLVPLFTRVTSDA